MEATTQPTAQEDVEAASTSGMAKALDAPVFGRRNILVALVLFFIAFVTLLAFEYRFGIQISGVSNAPHFVYQADSWLHGRWDVALPMGTNDTAYLDGKVYILYPPFPALLLLPLVAIFGLATSDVLFTTVCSAVNLSLLYLLFEQVRASGFTRRIWLENLIISVLLYYGSINLWLSLGGRMWFTAHIVCMTCTLLSLLLAFRRHFGWSAALLGCAFFTRGTLLLGFPLLFYLAWQDGGTQRLVQRFWRSLRARQPDWDAVPWRRLMPVSVALVVTGALFLVRNVVVFGSPLESGYNIVLRQEYPEATDGVFSLHYVPANIIANFFSFPRILFTGPEDRHPALDMLNTGVIYHGISGGVAVSILVTTPLFLGLLFWRNRQPSALRKALWVTLGLLVAAVLLFHQAGWYQFGARYLYDAYPYAFLLLALSEERVDWRWAVLGLVGILTNELGAHQFWTGQILHL